MRETFNLDTYFYEPDTKIENYTMTPQEQKYYYGDYTVYDYFQTNFVLLHIDAKGINGHPYQILSCDRRADGIYMHVQFTEFLDSYSKRDTLGNPYDIVWLQPSGNIFLEIGSGVPEDLGYYYDNSGWNKKYGKPAWAIRKEKEIGEKANE